MSKLLRADFTRLWKNKLFYAFLAVMAGIGVWLPLKQHYENQTVWADLETKLVPDPFFCYFGIIAVLLLSALVPLFIGTDYSDGAIRNKLIVGARRGHVYLSKLLTCLVALLLLDLAFIVPFLSLALPLLGPFLYGVKATVITVLYNMAMQAAFTALYVLLAMLFQSKAHSAVLCMALCAVLLVFGIWCKSRLEEPEMYPPSVELVVGEEGLDDAELVERPEEPNPNYVSGAARHAIEFLYHFSPGGQVIELSIAGGQRLWLMPLYSGIILVFSTAAGLLLFHRKDLK